MNIQKFEESVSKLSHEKMQAKTALFKKKLKLILTELTGTNSLREGSENFTILKEMLEIHSVDLRKNWPKQLWLDEQDRVRKELFGMMDTMQKALLAPEPCSQDDYPAED